MGTFWVEFADKSNLEGRHRVVKITANVLSEALAESVRKMRENEMIYVALGHVQGDDIPQIVWDFEKGERTFSCQN